MVSIQHWIININSIAYFCPNNSRGNRCTDLEVHDGAKAPYYRMPFFKYVLYHNGPLNAILR